MKQKEGGVLRDCLSCFAHHGFQVLMPGWKIAYEIPVGIKGIVWRNNVGGMRKGLHFIRFGVAGLPDITGVTRNGLFIGAEVKQPGQNPTDIQQWMHEIIRRLGGIVFVAHSYDECDAELKKGGL